MLIIHDASLQQWLRYDGPAAVIIAHSPAEVLPALEAVQRQVDAGKHAAGFVAYEAAPGCDPSLVTRADESGFPLLWFGLYDRPSTYTLPDAPQRPAIAWRPSISQTDYCRQITAIKAQIAAGNTYQVNFSLRLRAKLPADPWGLFLQMVQAQSADYGAFVDLGDWAIACASPELFFSRQGADHDPEKDHHIVSKPMKGTVPRGLNLYEDARQAAWLRASEKNRAENAMIVDMVRNDLGRVATLGSVEVPRLFDLERYPTVWQMTSTVQGRTQASTADLFGALFPPASITGAPKSRTMGLIAQLEDSPRRIYTGTIGFMRPDGRSQFNVAIRTVLIDRRRQVAEYGVGGGIVWDSQASEEYAECCAKAQVLHHQRPRFSLLESLRWTPETGYFLLERHLERLCQSAEYFGFCCDRQAVLQWLDRIVLPQAVRQAPGQVVTPDISPVKPLKVRLMLTASGQVSGEVVALPPSSPLTVCVAPQPVSASDVFLHHKTTHRQAYDQARQSAPSGIHDVILWNERGELTESTLGNLVVEIAGVRYTPPLSCGLLPGTFRAHLLDQGLLQERVILRSALEEGDRLFIINSVRGWQDATLKAL
ncbi:MAG: aminodeoxychorismate synthase component I [Elainellaceae cyanobacterium]